VVLGCFSLSRQGFDREALKLLVHPLRSLIIDAFRLQSESMEPLWC
jgi:hypothetical protein